MLNLFRTTFFPPRDLILLVAAGWAGLSLADQRARRLTGSDKALDAVIGVMLVAFLLGGRAFFLAGHMQAVLDSPASLFSLNTGLFDLWGGLLCAAIAAAITIQRRRLPPWETLDLLVPFLACLAIGLGLSHLASGTAFGRETNVPWAIYLWGALRHPTQIYELIAAAVILGIVWFRGERARPGSLFLLWLALAGASRLVIEGFRGDSTLVLGGFRLAQIIAWLVLAAALLVWELLLGKDGGERTALRLEGQEEDIDSKDAAHAKPKRTSVEKCVGHPQLKREV